MTDTQVTEAAPARELRPADRYEWESIMRRARLDGLIAGTGKVGKNGRATRGGVSGTAFMAVAMVWASHANPDGSSIHPGDATIALEAKVGIQVAQAVKRRMIELGLVEKVRARARRQRRGDEYRLTLPSDLLDAVEVLSPAALQKAAMDVYEKRRGKRGGSTGSPTDPDEGGPVDPPQDDDQPPVGDPVDPPHEESHESRGGSGGTTTDGCGGSGGTHVGGPVARDTYPRTATSSTSPSQTDEGVRTAVTVSRASGAAEEPDSRDEVSEPPPPPRPAGCPDHGPAMAAGTRPDGQPACTLCRVGAPPTVRRRNPDDDPEADHARDVVNGNPINSQAGRRYGTPAARDQAVAERLATVHRLHPRTA